MCSLRGDEVRRILSLLVGFLSWLPASTASAQLTHPFCTLGNSAQNSLVRGTVGAEMLTKAVQSNSLAFGAASVLDGKILPSLHRKGADVKGVFHEEFVSISNAMRAPYCLDEQGRGVAMAKVDISNSTFGGAVSVGPLSFFLAGSGTLWSAGRKNNERVGLAFGGFLGVALSLAAPFKRSFFENTLTTDLILGTSLKHPSVGAVGVGYLASQGVFTNLTEHHVRLFATSLINDGLALGKLPYLNVGISQFDWLIGEKIEKTVGYIAPSFRQNVFLRSPVDLEGKGKEEPQEDTSSPKNRLLRTLNLDRYGASDFLDVKLSYAIEPEPTLYEAALVLRTQSFLPERYLLQTVGEEPMLGARLTAGVINVPPLYYFGVPGGMKPRVQADWMAYVPGIGFRFYMTFGINSSDTLSVMPFAYNAFFLGITLNYVSKK
jgi:hypothetical protein